MNKQDKNSKKFELELNADNTEKDTEKEKVEFSLNDDRRVKTLSPGAMVMKRFFRNRLAVTGLTILVFMFLFSFVGGVLSPYTEDQFFYRTETQSKVFGGVRELTGYMYSAFEGQEENFKGTLQGFFNDNLDRGKTEFTYRKTQFTIEAVAENLHVLKNAEGTALGYATVERINFTSPDKTYGANFNYAAVVAKNSEQPFFEYDGKNFVLEEDGSILEEGNEIAYINRYSVNAVDANIFLPRDFVATTLEAIDNKQTEFTYTFEGKEEQTYTLVFDAEKEVWDIRQGKDTRVYDIYSEPSAEHWLGTDGNGMDMLTRLMYGGRVSLVIGFIVVFLECILGIIMGGISGYFGGWVDNLIMRVVDVFYCIPSTPILIMIGAMMDAERVEPEIRMLYLMLILGFLGWPGVARMVRGQILSLREQEFMTATEACGIRVSRRIFRHLVPNVIPQLIVIATMGLGSTIITEATLSFLGLGVKFPFASWGNIINDVNNTFVLTSYWFIWIPAGICLLLTVLAFNLVGDGLRDAFDPKMKR